MLMVRRPALADFRTPSHQSYHSLDVVMPRRMISVPYCTTCRLRPRVTMRASGKTTSVAPLPARPSISTRKRAFTSGSWLLDTLDALVHELQRFDEDVIARGVQISRVVFDRPGVGYHVARLVSPRFVLHYDDDFLAARGNQAAGDVLVPLEELERARDAPFRRHVTPHSQSAQLSSMWRIDAFTVVDGIRGTWGDGHFAEACCLEAVDLEPEAKVAVGVLAGHAFAFRRGRLGMIPGQSLRRVGAKM